MRLLRLRRYRCMACGVVIIVPAGEAIYEEEGGGE